MQITVYCLALDPTLSNPKSNTILYGSRSPMIPLDGNVSGRIPRCWGSGKKLKVVAGSDKSVVWSHCTYTATMAGNTRAGTAVNSRVSILWQFNKSPLFAPPFPCFSLPTWWAALPHFYPILSYYNDLITKKKVLIGGTQNPWVFFCEIQLLVRPAQGFSH